MMPAPMVLLTIIVVVKKKSIVVNGGTSFGIVGVTSKNATFLILITTQLSGMNIAILLPNRTGSPVWHLVLIFSSAH